MQTNLLDYVLGQIDARKSKLIVISRDSGVPYETLKKIAHRRTPNPGVLTVQMLADYFAQQESQAHLLPEINSPKPVADQQLTQEV